MAVTKYPRTPSGEAYLTPKDLSERWGLTEQTLNNWRCQGKGPTFSRGGLPGVRVSYLLTNIKQYEENLAKGDE